MHNFVVFVLFFLFLKFSPSHNSWSVINMFWFLKPVIMMVGTFKKSIPKPDVIMFLSPESISALQNTGQMVSLYLSQVTLPESQTGEIPPPPPLVSSPPSHRPRRISTSQTQSSQSWCPGGRGGAGLLFEEKSRTHISVSGGEAGSPPPPIPPQGNTWSRDPGRGRLHLVEDLSQCWTAVIQKKEAPPLENLLN